MKILTVANIVPRKRIDLCAMACRELEKNNQAGTIKWTVIGRGPRLEEIKAIAPQSMEFIPKVEELKEYFNSADVFVLPSLDEGFGMVYIEAIMCGCPVVCRKNDGGEEIVNTTGGGIAIEIPDSNQEAVNNIVDAVKRIVSNRAAYANDQATKFARDMVDPDKIKKQWAAIIEDSLRS